MNVHKNHDAACLPHHPANVKVSSKSITNRIPAFSHPSGFQSHEFKLRWRSTGLAKSLPFRGMKITAELR
jgi:hypothetical protein